MATAVEVLRRQALQRAVYARFTTAPDPRLKAVLQQNAWLLAQHAVDAVLEAEASIRAAQLPSRSGEPGGDPVK